MNRAWLSDMCVVCRLLWYILQHWVSGLIVKWRIFLKTMTMRMTNYDHDDFWIAELFIHLYPQIIAYWPEKFRRYSQTTVPKAVWLLTWHFDLFNAKKLKKKMCAPISGWQRMQTFQFFNKYQIRHVFI